MTPPQVPKRQIKFAAGQLAALRERLLDDLSTESFAVLLGRTATGRPDIVRVVAARFPSNAELVSRSRGHVTPSKDFIHRVLGEVAERMDVDCIIDVHTHPFSRKGVRFSGIDDADEIGFGKFLADRFSGLHYASIVFSQTDYEARFWDLEGGPPVAEPAVLRTQSPTEGIPSTDDEGNKASSLDPFHSRTEAALGVESLRKLMAGQEILIAGAGGLGSVLAENLVQMGFQKLVLVDPDRIEVTNLNRLVGATYADALRGRSKVSALKRHLMRKNPNVQVVALKLPIQHPKVRKYAASADWIVVTTDNHASRAEAQRLSHAYFTPLLTAGVNITVEDGEVIDVSGEVINCKNGSGFCLSCIARLNYAKIAAETNPDPTVREGLVTKGYVKGQDVPEPAVKPLNSIVASIATNVLVNEYTGRQILHPILVFEDNARPLITEDELTFEAYRGGCYSCQIAEQWT